MHISDQGLKALELEEGVVLKAYRDSAGVWTIGAGLTAASGVVRPVAGMTITREQADALLREALKTRYEPAVEVAMTVTDPTVQRPAQHEFDAGVSFHFNTGAIGKASWVRLWKAKAGRRDISEAMILWSKAGGKVLPALQVRRVRESAMLLGGEYRAPPAAAAPNPGYARWGLPMTGGQIAAVREGLGRLGYDPGEKRDVVLLTTARAFQRDHDLTVDGVIGRATLSTLQRALDARSKAKLPVTAVIAAAPAAAAGIPEQLTGLAHTSDATLLGAAILLASHAWVYRDIIAATIAPAFPRLSTFLRRF